MQLLKEIRKADDSVKKRWLISLTAISALIIVAIWSWHLSISVESLHQASDEPGFFEIFSKGLAVITDRTAVGLANSYVFLKDKAESRNSFTINKLDHQFVYRGLGQIEQRPFPNR